MNRLSSMQHRRPPKQPMRQLSQEPLDLNDVKISLKGDIVPAELKAQPEEELKRREAWWQAFKAN